MLYEIRLRFICSLCMTLFVRVGDCNFFVGISMLLIFLKPRLIYNSVENVRSIGIRAGRNKCGAL